MAENAFCVPHPAGLYSKGQYSYCYSCEKYVHRYILCSFAPKEAGLVKTDYSYITYKEEPCQFKLL